MGSWGKLNYCLLENNFSVSCPTSLSHSKTEINSKSVFERDYIKVTERKLTCKKDLCPDLNTGYYDCNFLTAVIV